MWIVQNPNFRVEIEDLYFPGWDEGIGGRSHYSFEIEDNHLNELSRVKSEFFANAVNSYQQRQEAESIKNAKTALTVYGLIKTARSLMGI